MGAPGNFESVPLIPVAFGAPEDGGGVDVEQPVRKMKGAVHPTESRHNSSRRFIGPTITQRVGRLVHDMLLRIRAR